MNGKGIKKLNIEWLFDCKQTKILHFLPRKCETRPTKEKSHISLRVQQLRHLHVHDSYVEYAKCNFYPHSSVEKKNSETMQLSVLLIAVCGIK